MYKHLEKMGIEPADFFERILSQVEDYISVWNREKQFVYVNARLEELWPFAVGEYVGKTPTELGFSREGARLFERNIQAVIETEDSVYGHFPYTPPLGGLRDYEFCFSPVFNAQGEVEFVAGFTRDVTELRAVRRALADSRTEEGAKRDD